MTLTLEVVTDAQRFAAVSTPWTELWNRTNGRVFQRHDWIAGWLEGVRDRREISLRVALAWEGATLRGVFPCAVHRRRGLRVLHWAAQLFSDYCDCLIDPSLPSEPILSALWEAIWRSGRFDVLSLQQVRPDAACRPLMDRLTVQNGPLQIDNRTERCLRIENQWTTGEAFFRSLNKKARNNHTRGKRIIGEISGEVSFRVVPADGNVERLLIDIIRMKELWLRANDPASLLLTADSLVLKTVLTRACASGAAQLFLLEAGGKLVAASVNFIYPGHMEAYFTSYDVEFERASPGTVLIVEYAKWAFDRAFSHVDFLRGEEAFKFRMANAETMLTSYVASRTLLGQFAKASRSALNHYRSLLRHDTTSEQSAEPPL